MKCKSDTQKILAVRDYHKGKKVVDICKEYNCAKNTFYTFCFSAATILLCVVLQKFTIEIVSESKQTLC